MIVGYQNNSSTGASFRRFDRCCICGRLSDLGVDISRNQICDRDDTSLSDGRQPLCRRRNDPVLDIACDGSRPAAASRVEDGGVAWRNDVSGG